MRLFCLNESREPICIILFHNSLNITVNINSTQNLNCLLRSHMGGRILKISANHISISELDGMFPSVFR